MRSLATMILLAALTVPAHAEEKEAPSQTPQPEYGVGFRLRSVRIPEPLLELFIARVPGGIKTYGIGLELARRRGDLELQIAAEFEYIEPKEGAYIEDGADVSRGDEADYVLAPTGNNKKRFGWLTFEFTFLNHAKLTDYLAIRYGAGLGVGFFRGSLARYDIICAADATNDSPEPGCVPPDPPFNGTGMYSDDGGKITPGTKVRYEMPPVMPVVNAIIGIQIRPFRKMTINVEGGIRTVPFFGASTSVFF